MFGPLLLLAALIIPSALQQQPETVSQNFAKLATWLENWQTLSFENQALSFKNQLLVITRQVTRDSLPILLEEIVAKVIQNVTSQLLLQCNSSQLLIDLQILKGRQAVSGAVQGGQVFMFVAYLVTIAVLYLVKHCKKHQQEVARTEFELLEAKLQASRSKRRAAAARADKQSPQ